MEVIESGLGNKVSNSGRLVTEKAAAIVAEGKVNHHEYVTCFNGHQIYEP